MLDQAELKKLLIYDPLTGFFFWRVKISKKIIVGSRAGYPDTANGYWRIGIGRVFYRAHQLAWLYMTGEWLSYPEYEIDHEDGEGYNNIWTNLRKATHSQNCRNRGPSSNNRLGKKGVYFINGSYRAAIYMNSKLKYIGTYKTFELASDAYDTLASIRDKDIRKNVKH